MIDRPTLYSAQCFNTFALPGESNVLQMGAESAYCGVQMSFWPLSRFQHLDRISLFISCVSKLNTVLVIFHGHEAAGRGLEH
jgi:hypothetical protein